MDWYAPVILIFWVKHCVGCGVVLLSTKGGSLAFTRNTDAERRGMFQSEPTREHDRKTFIHAATAFPVALESPLIPLELLQNKPGHVSGRIRIDHESGVG